MNKFTESTVEEAVLEWADGLAFDEEFEDITEGEEQTSKEKLKTKWAALEALGQAVLYANNLRNGGVAID